MNQSNCGYCYQPTCSECNPPIVGRVEFTPSINAPTIIFTISDSPSPITYTTVALRDQIAIGALQSLLIKSTDPTRGRINPSDEKCYAEQAYNYADAMLKARSK